MCVFVFKYIATVLSLSFSPSLFLLSIKSGTFVRWHSSSHHNFKLNTVCFDWNYKKKDPISKRKSKRLTISDTSKERIKNNRNHNNNVNDQNNFKTKTSVTHRESVIEGECECLCGINENTCAHNSSITSSIWLFSILPNHSFTLTDHISEYGLKPCFIFSVDQCRQQQNMCT